jgi:hypothetical protein
MLDGRGKYIWKLAPVINTEGGVQAVVDKAKRAQLSSVWVKIANGTSRYSNVQGQTGNRFRELIELMGEEGIDVWGWHVPRVLEHNDAHEEADLTATIADEFELTGVLMDSESGSNFFQGTAQDATNYASRLRSKLNASGRSLAISSHDIPGNFPTFPFFRFAAHAEVNAPQVYYGGSPSVQHRLDRAIDANANLSIPFVPVGAGWVGSGGGCSSAGACAERALAFMHLCKTHGFGGYSFWHWFGAPTALWQVLYDNPVFP